jgi:hypothetical protein
LRYFKTLIHDFGHGSLVQEEQEADIVMISAKNEKGAKNWTWADFVNKIPQPQKL